MAIWYNCCSYLLSFYRILNWLGHFSLLCVMKRFAIFHRHGHRAPAKNIFNTKEEVDLWTSFCYRQSDKSMLNTRYPVVQHLENAAPPDVTHEPFGCLSVLGSNHLTKVGASIGKRFPSLAQLHNMSDNPVITAVSTNYSRTQVSGDLCVVVRMLSIYLCVVFM